MHLPRDQRKHLGLREVHSPETVTADLQHMELGLADKKEQPCKEGRGCAQKATISQARKAGTLAATHPRAAAT